MRERTDCGGVAGQSAPACGQAPQDIVMVGDSAGATLPLVTLRLGIKAGVPVPACEVLLSPAVDCTMNSHSMVENAARDPLLHPHHMPAPVAMAVRAYAACDAGEDDPEAWELPVRDPLTSSSACSQSSSSWPATQPRAT